MFLMQFKEGGNVVMQAKDKKGHIQMERAIIPILALSKNAKNAIYQYRKMLRLTCSSGNFCSKYKSFAIFHVCKFTAFVVCCKNKFALILAEIQVLGL